VSADPCRRGADMRANCLNGWKIPLAFFQVLHFEKRKNPKEARKTPEPDGENWHLGGAKSAFCVESCRRSQPLLAHGAP